MNSRRRLRTAFACYGVLAILSGLTLDGPLRVFLLLFFAGLAVKTWVAFKTEQGE